MPLVVPVDVDVEDSGGCRSGGGGMRCDGGKSSMVCCSLSLAAGGEGVVVVVSGVVSGVVSVGAVELSVFSWSWASLGTGFHKVIACSTFKTYHRLAGIFKADGDTCGHYTTGNVTVDLGKLHDTYAVFYVFVTRFLKM